MKMGMAMRGVALAALGALPVWSLEPPPTVPKVDLARYMGAWYEIARLPNPFQKKCVQTTAVYTLTGEGRFSVVNGCLTDQGRWKEAQGRARVVDMTTGSKLEVSFFWPFYGDYWVLDLDTDYRWALVGTPNRKYLWVISRSKTLPKEVLDAILRKANGLGFDLSRLVWPQNISAQAR